VAELTLFLAGDVMTGRGIDQILPTPADPELHERWVRSALHYVHLAERAHGTIPKPAGFEYVWGDTLAELERVQPDARIVNLETSVTNHRDAWPKAVNYRMSPANAGCLTAAKLDCCVLANNHAVDYGFAGLEETLDTLRGAGLRVAGAGRTLAEAEAPAIVEIAGKGRVLVFAFGIQTGGIPPEWAATPERPGIAFLPELTTGALEHLASKIRRGKRESDVVVASIHWGPNWGYDVSADQRSFARGLIEHAAVDLVYGHSSHHAKVVEVHRGKLILYGCGDFINDYEGIPGYEDFRDDLALMYLIRIEATSGLRRLALVPFRIERFRLTRASQDDALWIRDTLNREGGAFGSTFTLRPDRTLELILS
jgi:poly-gamma-glutamate capsule biosynthesis protein CapA/YwtB (metallophosphatase superfamily)